MQFANTFRLKRNFLLFFTDLMLEFSVSNSLDIKSCKYARIVDEETHYQTFLLLFILLCSFEKTDLLVFLYYDLINFVVQNCMVEKLLILSGKHLSNTSRQFTPSTIGKDKWPNHSWVFLFHQ